MGANEEMDISGSTLLMLGEPDRCSSVQSREQGPLVCSGGASRSLRLTDGHLGDLCIPVDHSSVLRLPEFPRRNKYLQLRLLE